MLLHSVEYPLKIYECKLNDHLQNFTFVSNVPLFYVDHSFFVILPIQFF
nr:MAG TPA: hypothetical protein [Caudoviricetes sp.]